MTLLLTILGLWQQLSQTLSISILVPSFYCEHSINSLFSKLNEFVSIYIYMSQDGVFLMNGCCDPFNEKALRASRGACFWIPIACGNWNHLKDFATSKKMKLYAGEPANDFITNPFKQDLNLNDKSKFVIDFEGANILATNLNEDPMCLVLGSEGLGLSPEVKGACSSISIPMPGRFESLNVAVAGGILLYLLQKKNSLP
mgnify:CR=1 FL=1